MTIDYSHLTLFTCFAITRVALSSRERELKRERAKSATLETLLAARIEAEDAAVAQAYCCGWSEREALEECLREERMVVAMGRVKGLVN